jgi:protein pelota
MRILRHDPQTVRIRIETVEDLWGAQRVIFPGDVVKGRSERKFRPTEDDKAERKDVIVTLRVEKTEFDTDASRLRISGIIMDGHPIEYVQLRSHHTINIPPKYELEISKESWSDYMLKVIKDAVSDTSRPRLGIITADDEKATSAVLLGYGVKFRREIYSGLSKRMSQKDFKIQQEKYYREIAEEANAIEVGTVVIAGPGFAKDDVRDYIGRNKKTVVGKDLIYEYASNAERTGVYEVIKSKKTAALLGKEKIRKEFVYMEEFLKGLSGGASRYGKNGVNAAIKDYEASTILVNDSELGDNDIRRILDIAESKRIHIEVFNSMDEVGQQLNSFKGIASIYSD